MATYSNIQPWWLEPLPDSATVPGSAITGLSGAEAKVRLAKFGPNLFSDHQEQSLWLQFLSRFKNPLILLLLVASAISAMTGELTNFFIIFVMVSPGKRRCQNKQCERQSPQPH